MTCAENSVEIDRDISCLSKGTGNRAWWWWWWNPQRAKETRVWRTGANRILLPLLQKSNFELKPGSRGRKQDLRQHPWSVALTLHSSCDNYPCFFFICRFFAALPLLIALGNTKPRYERGLYFTRQIKPRGGKEIKRYCKWAASWCKMKLWRRCGRHDQWGLSVKAAVSL